MNWKEIHLRYNQQEGAEVENIGLFNMDLVAEVIRIEETNYGKEPNWCRGIAMYEDSIFVTIDGRYGTDLSFGVLSINNAREVESQYRLKWSEVGNEEQIRYVAGFDLTVF